MSRYDERTDSLSGHRDSLQPCQDVAGDVEQLQALVEQRMPFGKYRGRRLIELPEPYLVWFSQQGFPEGKLGRMLATVHTIKVNGLEYLFEPLLQGGRKGE